MTKNTSIFSGIAIGIAVLFIGCNNVTISTGDGSDKISGNGKASSEQREIGSFKAISLEGAFNATLQQADKEGIKVEADENVLSAIITAVENDTLKVRMKDNTTIQNMSKLTVAISLVNISEIKTNGAGSLSSIDTLHLNELNVDLNGAGATKLNLVADKLTIDSKTVGALFLAGKVKETTINHNGVGLIQAFDLKSEKLTLKADGVGAAEVFASQELNIDASGVGSIKYKGGAAKTQIENNGVGKVACVDCK